MTKLNELQRAMLTLAILLSIAIAISVIASAIYAFNYRRNDPLREFDGGNVRGCIYGYAEPEQEYAYDNGMKLYIVVGRLDRVYLVGLSEEIYDTMDESLKSAIDIRKTGFYVDFETVTTKAEQMFSGFKRVSSVYKYNLSGPDEPQVTKALNNNE